MAVLNYSCYPNILSWGKKCNAATAKLTFHDGTHGHRYLNMRDYTDTDYWYVEILHGDAFYCFPLTDLMSAEILSRVRNREVTILVCHHHEAYHSIIHDLYEFLIEANNIPPEQVLLLTNSPDIMTEINYVSSIFNIGPINAEWMVEFEMSAAAAAQGLIRPDMQHAVSKTLVDKEYPKKFLSFNGIHRPHRSLIVALLASSDLLKYGHISYNSYTFPGYQIPTPKEIYDSMIIWTGNSPKFTEILTNNKEKLIQLDTIYLDDAPKIDKVLMVDYFNTDCVSFYEETYFSIVTETLCMRIHSHDGHTGIGRILSEKTFKAILNKHPFIIVGVPKTLQLLKNLGYKTFSPWIDEAYDDEYDDCKRLLMIAEEVKKLTELTPEELTNFLKFAREIVEYNFNVLLMKGQLSNFKWIVKLNNKQFKVFSEFGIPCLKYPTNPYITINFETHSAYCIKYHELINTYQNIKSYPSTALSMITEAILNHIKTDPTSILIIVHDWSPLYVDDFIESIKELLTEVNENQVYIIIMDSLQLLYIKQTFLKENINAHITARNRLLINETIEFNGPIVEESHLFSIFSRSSREWRFHFFCDLIVNGLLDKCIYSYINASPYIEGEHPTEIDDIKKMIPSKYNVIPYNRKINDWVDGMPYAIEKNIHNYYAPTLFDAINQSAIHIVIETMSTGELVYITEKTWKPISVKKPFIIYGVFNSLVWLHKLGYKTFHPFINEEYDTICDDTLRKQAIIEEMKRISSMNSEELTHLLENCKGIIEYNYQRFVKERNYIWSPEFETLGIFK
jgi:hypothetical protein